MRTIRFHVQTSLEHVPYTGSVTLRGLDSPDGDPLPDKLLRVTGITSNLTVTWEVPEWVQRLDLELRLEYGLISRETSSQYEIRPSRTRAPEAIDWLRLNGHNFTVLSGDLLLYTPHAS